MFRLRNVASGLLLSLSAAALLLAGADPGREIQNDVQLRAMVDELARSKTLQISNLDKPYFIQYTSSDAENAFINGSLGGLTNSNRIRFRAPRLEVRVGDYKFDNTNSIYSGSARSGLFPIDDDYGAIRGDLWLATDGLYKSAADQITRKRTALREIADADSTPDLAPAKPIQLIERPAALNYDAKYWEKEIRELSGRFAAHPDITNSHVRFRAVSSTYRLVNTEGSVVRIPQEMSEVEIVSNAVAPDGNRIWNHQFFTTIHLAELPNAGTLQAAVDSVAAETEALAKAPVADDYSGPVLFEGEAAAEMMAQVLEDSIRLERKPLAPPGAQTRFQALDSVWSARLGSRVTPEWLSIVDDPRALQFSGTPLAGSYEVDDEGVPSEKVILVDKGTLKSFLFSRQPVRAFAASNGHGRLPGAYGSEAAVIGNIFVQANQALTEAQLKTRLLEKVKASGLKFGIVVRRMDFPSTASLQELQSMAKQLERNGDTRTLNSPLIAVRVYLDGHEQLVRGLRFKEFSAKDLRDVDAASDHPYVLNYVNNGSGFNLVNSSTDATSSAVVCPSLLFDSIDMARVEEDAGRLPLVAPPPLVASSGQ